MMVVAAAASLARGTRYVHDELAGEPAGDEAAPRTVVVG